MSSAALTQAPPLPCNISVSELTPGRDSVSLEVTTPGRNCSFLLIPLDGGGDVGECRRTGAAAGGRERGGPEEAEGATGGGRLGSVGEEGGVFLCGMDGLEAGTSYQLQIRSQTDDQEVNVTMATSKSQPDGDGAFKMAPNWGGGVTDTQEVDGSERGLVLVGVGG